MPIARTQRLVCFFVALTAGLAVASCDSNSDLVPSGSNNADLRQRLAPVRYTEHLVCQLEAESSGWQHLYRLDLQRPRAEFLGGQGGRFTTLYSQVMAVSADWVTMTFDPSSESKDQDVRLEGFQVHIHRSTLAYRWFWAAGQIKPPNLGTPDMQGRCTLLDAKHFIADPPT